MCFLKKIVCLDNFLLTRCLKCILNVYLTHSLCGLVQGLIAGDSISPDKPKVSGKEGASVTLRCSYETSVEDVWLFWYRHHSNQAPQLILYKGARSKSGDDNIPDTRYESTTSRTSTELTITQLTLADTAQYYCALWRHSDTKCGGAFT